MRRIEDGSPEPLGLTLVAGGANVAVYSAHATAITLCLFDAHGEREAERIALPARTGNVFHGFVPGIEAGTRYGLRAQGPWAPHEGHRFNDAKLLADPYAMALDRPFRLHPSQLDRDTLNPEDSASTVPKAIALPMPEAALPLAPGVPWRDTVIYELHVRGFTQRHPDIPQGIRGTAAGLAHPAAIEHLARLGVTTVELMPIAAWVDERHLPALGLTNYWGYNPVTLLAPDPRLAPGGLAELAACVSAMHAAGIEVLLDVVLNHTGEGDALGPTLSLRGLDNASYYRLRDDDRAQYVNDTGCGNTLALDSPPALRLALDTLRHYVRHAGVDGFRFDLATTLGRRADGFDPASPLLTAIAADPILRDRKLVAEPWDVGPGGHRLGAFPEPWGEWNDRYRDAARRFWRGDARQLGDLATRVAGSSDLFGSRARTPSRSINFVTAHDGFTLVDLVSHSTKRNLANGEQNRDGTDHNLSWNHGIEGASSDEAVRAARSRDAHALLATLAFSRGTPMLSMGDELGRSQSGNNNAYAQDNALSWVDWASADSDRLAFTANLLRIRREHRALRDDRWLTGEPADATGIPDVEWRLADGRTPSPADWHAPEARTLLACLYVPANGNEAADRVVVALNGSSSIAPVQLPEPRDGFAWQRLIDSAAPAEPEAHAPGLAARSVTLFSEKPSQGGRTRAVDARSLEPLARAAGIAPTWRDVTGREHAVGTQTTRALLAAMGLEARTPGQARERVHTIASQRSRRSIPRSQVVRQDEAAFLPLVCDATMRRARLRVTRSDGRSHALDADLTALPEQVAQAEDGAPVRYRLLRLPPLAPGRYGITLEETGVEGHLIVAPRRCHLPPALERGERHVGLAAHLYTLRRPGCQGIGDFTALAEASEATARAGGSLVGINPVHALFPESRDRASPYHPSDRRFLDPIYLDLAAVPDVADSTQARGLLQSSGGAIAALDASRYVDYPAVWATKRAVLLAGFQRFRQRPASDARVARFHGFVSAGGADLARFATFQAMAATLPGTPWTQWPADCRRPEARGVANFAASQGEAIAFAMYLQWLADGQLGAAAQRARESGLAIGLYRDLAVGTAPDGAEAWSTQDALAAGISIGAPPDPFCQSGQVWQLPPPLPDAWRSEGYATFERLLDTNMRHAGALRIDHVMGLDRLFWIPEGASGAEGAYVAYPREDLLGVLSLASTAAQCLVVGEDLGTVPEGFRERLTEANVLSYRVAWFERDGPRWHAPQAYPRLAAACVSTHDLPTVAGWWAGTDLDERERLGLARDEALAEERAQRERDRASLAASLAEADPNAATIATALHRFLAQTPCALTLVQADDLAEETEALNVPGTDRERPNWRRRLGVDASELWETPLGRSLGLPRLP